MTVQVKNPIKLIILFLLPSFLVLTIYYLLSSSLWLSEIPIMITFGIAGLITMVPVMLGIILIDSKRKLGQYSITKMLPYKKKISFSHYLWLVPALVVWGGGVFLLTGKLDAFLKTNLFYWYPPQLEMTTDYTIYSEPQILTILISIVLIIGIAIPVIEEIYFRGYLLPRLKWMGMWAPVLNAFLFSLYHFWSPWQLVSRFIAVLPLCFVVYKTKNIRIAIIVHCILNILSAVFMIYFQFG